MNARISRRVFVRRVAGACALGLLTGCAAPLAGPQQSSKSRTIGYLAGSVSGLAESEPTFRQTLRDLGYVDGRDITIEVRTTGEVTERVSGLLSELIGIPVDVLVTQGTIQTLAAKQATKTIPIVFVRVTDPVAQGIVESLARPGRNMTGVSAAPSTGPKRLEILQAIVPGLRRVAVLWNANNSGSALQLRDTESAARTLGIELQIFGLRSPDELELVFETIARSRPDALLIESAFNQFRDVAQIPDFAAKMRLPQMYTTDAAFVKAGGLMALGPNQPSSVRIAAQLVDKILKGARPADLPVQMPTQIDFIVNLAAAERIGLTIPESVLRQATEVIR